MKKKYIIIVPSAIIIFVLILLASFFIGKNIGISYQLEKDATTVGENAKAALAISSLVLKTVPSIIAYGKVEKISGRNITVTYSGDTMTVPIEANASIYAIIKDVLNKDSGSQTSEQKRVNFNEIRTGNNVNISLKISPNGDIVGETVIILASANKANK